jgi:DNA-binding LacI/PurR family transcriptional regulator
MAGRQMPAKSRRAAGLAVADTSGARRCHVVATTSSRQRGSHVGLTTVRQPRFESGRRGGGLLLQMLAGAGQQLGEEHTEQLRLSS